MTRRIALWAVAVLLMGGAIFYLRHDDSLLLLIADRAVRYIQTRDVPHISQPLTGRSVSIDAERPDKAPLTPVSMTKIGENRFLFANYRNIYLMDVETGSARIVRPTVAPAIWNPTAVLYSSHYDRIFIANYTGNDVLIGRLTDGALEIEHRLQHESLNGPEGVSVSVGGRYLAVANYDGNSISLFERTNGEWQFRWTAKLPAAHGITIIDGYVYAGGEGIIKLDVLTGKSVAKLNRMHDSKIEFAACINHDEQSGGLIVSDTIAGRIYLLDRNLIPTGAFGANGPTLANFSMPYCAYRDSKSTWIISTFQERFIRIENGVTSYEMRKDNWQHMLPVAFSPTTWLRDRSSVVIAGKHVRPGYGSLRAEDGHSFVLPRMTNDGSNAWHNYLTTIAKDGEWVAVVANSSPVTMLYNQTTRELRYAAHGEFDCWASDFDLQCPSKRHSIGQLLERGQRVSPIVDAPKSTGRTTFLDYWSEFIADNRRSALAPRQ